MSKITNIEAFEVIDSRGIPTVEAIVYSNETSASAQVPSGASRGSFEAYELRDGDNNRFNGLGVLKAVANINTVISPYLKGNDVFDQKLIDNKLIELDATSNKKRLGANSILAVSLACCRLAAILAKIELHQYITNLFSSKRKPRQIRPIFNVINGGLHAQGQLSFQEFMFIPNGKTYQESLTIGISLYQLLKVRLAKANLSISLGDEGGFTPEFSDNQQALTFLQETIDASNFKFGNQLRLGLDVAANSLFQKDHYYLSDKEILGKSRYFERIIELCQKYSLEYLEDPLIEDDWGEWSKLTSLLKKDTLIVGDDLIATSVNRLQKAITLSACRGIIIKVNQIGTLSETLEVIKKAQKADFKIIISHRSGETTDSFIADLAYGVSAEYVKFGAPARGERVVKYNRLLQIYQSLPRFSSL